MPGKLGMKIDNNILRKLKFNGPVILVTGTNGKTSVANMIADLMKYGGYKVISNRKGDNLKAGIATTLLTNSSLGGKVKATACVLEVDELSVRHILPNLPVSAFVINNFFRDQLDRACEMEQLISVVEKVVEDYDQELILNGNDPNVVRMTYKAPKAHCTYYGIGKNEYSSESTSEASEGKFCPLCGGRLEYTYYQYSHIGEFACTSCEFKTPKLDVCLENINLDDQTFESDGISYQSPYEGMYSMYNCAAVLAAAKKFGLSEECVKKVFANAPQPKGRNERFEKDGKQCVLNLIKNPTGANEVMKVIERDKSDKNICIVLNDGYQDGRDISWIYDAAFEKLIAPETKKIICSGARGNDMALRIYYGGYEGELQVIDSVEEAVEHILDGQNKCYAIATYTALLPTRQAISKGMKL